MCAYIPQVFRTCLFSLQIVTLLFVLSNVLHIAPTLAASSPRELGPDTPAEMLVQNPHEAMAAFAATYNAYNKAVEEDRFQEASQLARLVLDHAIALNRPEEDLVTLSLNLGYVLSRAGYKEAAREALADSLDRHIALYGKNAPELASVYEELGKVHLDHNSTKARDHFAAAIKNAERDENFDTVMLARLWRLQSNANGAIGGIKQGQQGIKIAIRIHEENDIPDANEYGLALFIQGKYQMLRKPDKAVDSFNKALAVLTPILSPGHQRIQAIHIYLIQAYEQDKKPDMATAHVHALTAMMPEENGVEPVPLYKAPRDYPRLALKTGTGAELVVSFNIAKDGSVTDAEITETKVNLAHSISAASYMGRIRSDFKRASLNYVQDSRFKPGLRNGEFVERTDQRIRLIWDAKYWESNMPLGGVMRPMRGPSTLGF